MDLGEGVWINAIVAGQIQAFGSSLGAKEHKATKREVLSMKKAPNRSKRKRTSLRMKTRQDDQVQFQYLT